MSENTKNRLTQEATEAEARAEAEERGELKPLRGQRPSKPSADQVKPRFAQETT